MLDVWTWISELPDSAVRAEPDSSSPQVFELASSKTGDGRAARSIRIRADWTSRPGSEPAVTLAVLACGFQESGEERTLWVSDACPLSSDKPFLPLLLQLLRETISRSPAAAHGSSCPRSQLQKLRPDPVSWIMDSHSPESLSSFFNLVFLTRMFWACSFNAPSEVGSFYFESLLAPNLEVLSCEHAPVLRTFLRSVGVDAEACFMRALGYMLAKWLILREVGVGLQALTPLPVQGLSFSYATEAHGLWILKGYSPVAAMKLTCSNDQMKFPVRQAKDSILKYVLAHQQLEAVVQFEYLVKFHDGYIQVNARVDNIRLHVVNLGFGKESGGDDLAFAGERHFPSRARIWVGPEVGATYVGGLSLGRSTSNGERELETHRVMKSTLGKPKATEVKAAGKTATRVRLRNWRWDQDSEGNAAVFDAVLCDNTTGQEVAAWHPPAGGGDGFRRRYATASRPFTKSGGLVFAGDEYGESVGWRLSREMEGSVLKWRIGGQVWLSYLANDVKSSYFETRVVEWCDEIDLPLIPGKVA
ncbi:uncharacterized protein LOC115757169 [Rhodamnia argentea]|uniref:Uncharacterized protein LOC115757169 n=1 Tax=Rhodamnia argentea TaxID=178133 RepID=A0A8B8R3T5_9MYRT|nr:uncharacterized protein LOC115757169 [Rhodamnia argentea]